MSKPIIEVKNVSKKYKIGQKQRYYSFRDSLNKIVTSPFKISKQEKLSTDNPEEFWALKDVSFKVMPGEVLGIIGKNGAGKSTLLKILSQITPPTQGEIKLRGRVASLLEVGTGFHPELTGRENIYLNGAILGMSRAEIRKKFDEIVDFAEISQFLDTPVKHYSSGMYMRLAFAVAAHLEPEILLVDEVLAVGDANFQKKCLGKMSEVSKQGRTVLFVSHNMGAISQLCTRAIYIKNGVIAFEGKTQHAIDSYLKYYKNNLGLNEPSTKAFRIIKLYVKHKGKNVAQSNVYNFIVELYSKEKVSGIEIGIGLNDRDGKRILTFFSRFYGIKFHLKKGLNQISCKTNLSFLKPDVYRLSVMLGNGFEILDHVNDLEEFTIEQSPYPGGVIPDDSQGIIVVKQDWKIIA
ncbi:MAG: polysaccharide ABC transporter ATP-binding protein [Patescibacteria group bacterium]|nr:polysaccharide ABC transporter ATP-binding protein [Patescibacteria group bacterium]